MFVIVMTLHDTIYIFCQFPRLVGQGNLLIQHISGLVWFNCTFVFSFHFQNFLFIFLFSILIFPNSKEKPMESISYHTSRYGWYLLYRNLGRYRNASISFRFKYWLYWSHSGNTRENTRLAGKWISGRNKNLHCFVGF